MDLDLEDSHTKRNFRKNTMLTFCYWVLCLNKQYLWPCPSRYNLAKIFPLELNAVIKDFKYADTHEWVKVDGSSATVGITDHAQDHLGDVVYVELPEVGAAVTQGGSFGAVESVKATSDINSPISGKVVEVNEELTNSPGLVSPWYIVL